MRRDVLLGLLVVLSAVSLQAMGLKERIQQRRILKAGATPEDAALMRHFHEMASSADIPGSSKELRIQRYNSGTWMDLSEIGGGDWALLNDRSWYIGESRLKDARKGGTLDWRKVMLYDNDSSMGDISLGEYLDHFESEHDHRAARCRVMLPQRVKFPTVRKIPKSAQFPSGILLYVTKTKEARQEDEAEKRRMKIRLAAQAAEEEQARFDHMEGIVAGEDRVYAEGWKKTAPTSPGRWVALEALRPGDVVRISQQPRILENGGASRVLPRKYIWPSMHTEEGVPEMDYGYLGPSSYGRLSLENALEQDGKRPSLETHLRRGVSLGLEFDEFVSTFRLRRDPSRGMRHGTAHFEMFVYPAGSREASKAKMARETFLAELSEQQRQFDAVLLPGIRQHHANLKKREENRIAGCHRDWVSWYTSLEDCLANRNQRMIMYRPITHTQIGRPKNTSSPSRPASSGDPWAKDRNNRIDYTIRQGQGHSVGTYNPNTNY